MVRGRFGWGRGVNSTRWIVPVVALGLLGGCTQAPARVQTSASSVAPGPSITSASPSPSETPAGELCLAEARSLSLDARVGQLIMVGVEGGLDAAEKRALTKYHIGSVVLLGDQSDGVAATAELTQRLVSLDPASALLVAADQEGGTVQRLTGTGFSRIPSAAKQATRSDDALRKAAKGWGGQLVEAGVRMNLAPVADVVPAAKKARNAPIGALGRGYGSDPKVVTAKTTAVIAGLEDAGVAATVKHFPGLGEVVGNTDHTARVVDTVTSAKSPSLQPFRTAAKSGVAAVMVSSATYTRIGAERQAVFSPKVIGLLRDWDYDGVVMSDDLGAAASLGSVPAKARAVRFLAAGGDLVINADPDLTAAMVAGVKARAEKDEEFADQLIESTARVLRLKQGLGRYGCR